MTEEFVIPSAEAPVEETHYKKHIYNASTLHLTKVECDTFDIGAHSASTFLIDELICKKTGKIRMSGSSTLIISNLKEIEGVCTIDVAARSTMRIDKGIVMQVVGEVHNCSTVICKAECIKPSDVNAKSWSKWSGC